MTKNEIISFLISPDFSGWLLVLKIIFEVFGFIFLILIIFALFKTSWFSSFFGKNLFEFFTFRPYGTKKFAKKWLKIITRLETNSEAEYKLAILEADSLLEQALEQSSYKGENMEERLNSINEMILPNIKELKESHKIRNNIVYDPDYKLSLEEAKKFLSFYEKALRDLEMI